MYTPQVWTNRISPCFAAKPLWNYINNLTSKLSFMTGFLWQLLCEIASQFGYSKQDSGVQTDPVKLPHTTSLGNNCSLLFSTTLWIVEILPPCWTLNITLYSHLFIITCNIKNDPYLMKLMTFLFSKYLKCWPCSMILLQRRRCVK